MRRPVRVAVVIGTVTATFGVGGGIAAWAAWSVGSAAVVVSAQAGTVPVVARPDVALSAGVPEVTWTQLTTSQVKLVDRYVVIRIGGARREVACDVDVSITSCRDQGVAPGQTVRYVVHAARGAHWVGQSSEPSEEVTVPERSVASERRGDELKPSAPGSSADAMQAAGTDPSDAVVPPPDEKDGAPARDGMDGVPARERTGSAPARDGMDGTPAGEATDGAPAGEATGGAPPREGTDGSPPPEKTAPETGTRGRQGRDRTRMRTTRGKKPGEGQG